MNTYSQARTLIPSSLYRSGDYSDFVIKCGNDRYKVHKAVVCPRSPFFRAIFNGNTKVRHLRPTSTKPEAPSSHSVMQESQESEVDMSAHEPIAVQIMVTYLYRDNYYDGVGGETSTGKVRNSKHIIL